MSKRLVFAAVAVACILLVGVGCELPLFSELAGTWKLSDGGVNESLTFCGNTFTYELSGSLTGKMKMSIDDYNDSLKHVLLTLTSAEGFWSGSTIGTVLYMTYSISGNSLYWDWDNSAYPAAPFYGPYTK